ncbi:DDE-type integrase/transposase/recombinase [uncultured Croceitalea sp.]|uniref:DDE-type integrase/transposase/recombinase n=1 Tax=uncultured Croceitalea sp. TaxID=1798908 RepID=UPI0033058E4F
MVRKGHVKLSISEQCRLLSLHRSGLYYNPKGETTLNLELMRMMDEHYLHCPEKGATRMHAWITHTKGYQVSKNRIERLYYKVMGLRAMLPGKHISKKNSGDKIYPNLLYKLDIGLPRQVWAVDVTYVPIKEGYLYLMAVVDLFGGLVVHWGLSGAMEPLWYTETLREAIELYGKPEIITIDKASQFTSEVFIKPILKSKIKVSVDAKRSVTEKVFVKSLWKNVKYDIIYKDPPKGELELTRLLREYFRNYNNSRKDEISF